MMINHHPLRSLTLALLAALALSACGGSDESNADVPVVANDSGQVPASATASAAAFSTYAAGLLASDSTEPMALEGMTPPVSDTDEPIALR